MKIYGKYFAQALFVVGIVVCNSVAQQVEISAERFLRSYDPMILKTDKQSRRITYLYEQSTTGYTPKASSKTVVEIVPPDRRFVRETSYSRPEEEEKESIYIGNTRYRRELKVYGGNPKLAWTVDEIEKQNPIQMTKPPISLSGAKMYLTENVVINGKMTDLFECIFEKPLSRLNKRTQLVEDGRRYREWLFWITKDGLLEKAEDNQSENFLGGLNMKMSFEYEYDVNIVIEAPIKKPQQ